MRARHSPTEEWQGRLGSSALNPVQVVELQEAIRKRKKVAILEGRKFLLTYHANGTVYYHPADASYAPCGYLNIKRFLEGI